MTAISPCPLATNISAIGFISRDIENRRRVFLNGLVYTLGRAISYTVLAVIIFFGASKMNISLIFQGWGEKILGPVLILIGLFMLDVIKIKFPGFSGITEKIGEKGKGSYWSTLLLGMVFALAFCPYSGVQWRTLFCNANSYDRCKCQRIISSGCLCHCNRTTCYCFCLVTGLYGWEYWQIIQSHQDF